MVDIEERGRAVGEMELAGVERKLKLQLPETYRRFLLEYNGGIPSPDIIDVQGLPGSPTDLQVLFGIDREVESSDLALNYSLFKKRLPNLRLLPIGCDSGGNLFCMDVRGDIVGQIFYCDVNSSAARLYEVAPSFDDFLGKLRPWANV